MSATRRLKAEHVAQLESAPITEEDRRGLLANLQSLVAKNKPAGKTPVKGWERDLKQSIKEARCYAKLKAAVEYDKGRSALSSAAGGMVWQHTGMPERLYN